MIVTKKALERRTFLRGMGVTLALPFLDAMVPALSRAAVTAAPIRRLGFFYIPNGVVMNKWTPAREGADFEFSPTLSALEPVKDRVLVLSGLGHNQANSFGDGNGDHSRAGSTCCLSAFLGRLRFTVLPGHRPGPPGALLKAGQPGLRDLSG